MPSVGQVWAAVGAAPPPLTDGAFGPPWQHVGEVPYREAELWKALKGRSGRSRISFYLDSKVDRTQFDALTALPPGLAKDSGIWLGIDKWGDGKELVVTTRPVQHSFMQRSAPESHPALDRTYPICLRVAAPKDDTPFRQVHG